MENLKETLWVIGKEYSMPKVIYIDLNEEVGSRRFKELEEFCVKEN